MLPTSARKSVRPSDARLFTENIKELPPNDDEEERRLARRRTMLRQCVTDENENLEKCLEIYKDNKISRENAWSLSVIDTLVVLLERHHNFLNNFKVACPSLEASSRVYGLRVDSIYGDVMRISAGLAARKFNKNVDVDMDDASNNEIDIANKSVVEQQAEMIVNAPKPKKRARRQVSTITKNKDTLNGMLETIPMDDAIFGKLNRVGGSINSSKRLMNNILSVNNFDLKLSARFRYWTKSKIDYSDDTQEEVNNREEDSSKEEDNNKEEDKEDVAGNLFSEIEKEEIDVKNDIDKFEEIKVDSEEEADYLRKTCAYLVLRSLHAGYTISSKGKTKYDDIEKENNPPLNMNNSDEVPRMLTPSELAVQFDINAVCEPVCLDPEPPMLDVDFCDFDDLTSDELTAINRCRGLRRSVQIMDDLRPVDSTSQLEYSYRPLHKISRFWAGPSHWKFKRFHPRQSSMLSSSDNQCGKLINQRALRAQVAKRRSKFLVFGTNSEQSLYLQYDKAKNQQRRTNIHKKWDQRKLKLPTDLRVNKNTFMRGWLVSDYGLTPSAYMRKTLSNKTAGTIVNTDVQPNDEHCGDSAVFTDHIDMSQDIENMQLDDIGVDFETQEGNETVLEIASEFDGAPCHVTKIVVPFAKRARHIDMKNLKKCCKSLVDLQLKTSAKEKDGSKEKDKEKGEQSDKEKENIYTCNYNNEKHAPGETTFADIYARLPDMLSKPNVASLTPIICFYSILHLANEHNLRLSESEVDNFSNFSIKKILQ